MTVPVITEYLWILHLEMFLSDYSTEEKCFKSWSLKHFKQHRLFQKQLHINKHEANRVYAVKFTNY